MFQSLREHCKRIIAVIITAQSTSHTSSKEPKFDRFASCTHEHCCGHTHTPADHWQTLSGDFPPTETTRQMVWQTSRKTSDLKNISPQFHRKTFLNFQRTKNWLTVELFLLPGSSITYYRDGLVSGKQFQWKLQLVISVWNFMAVFLFFQCLQTAIELYKALSMQAGAVQTELASQALFHCFLAFFVVSNLQIYSVVLFFGFWTLLIFIALWHPLSRTYWLLCILFHICLSNEY